MAINEPSMIERMRTWARQGVSVDVSTMILRSEGFADAEIASAYTQMVSEFDVEVERSIPTFMRRSSTG